MMLQSEALEILLLERLENIPAKRLSKIRVSNWDTREEAEHAAALLKSLWDSTGGDVGYPDPVVRPGKAPIYGKWEIVSRRVAELDAA